MKTIARGVGAVVAAMVVLAAVPAAAGGDRSPRGAAGAGTATGLVKLVMYEVTEALVFKQRDDVVRRLANASLLGIDVVPLKDGTPFRAGQFVTADATSNVNTVNLTGPVQGTIDILEDIDPTRSSLDTLVIARRLHVRGTLDLTQAATSAVATIEGTWRYDGERSRKPFAGVFLIPFQLAAGGPYFYANLGPGACATGSTDLGAVCTLTDREFVLGIPLTKAVVDFLE